MQPRYCFVVILVLSLAGCDAVIRPDTTTNGLALSSWAIAAATPVDDKPKPAPDDDKCQNCNGTGKVGDGRVSVKCRVCNGTGKKKVTEVSAAPPEQGQPPAPEVKVPPTPKKPEIPEPNAKRYVLMYSRPDCPNCDKWMIEEADNWRRQGYTVLTRQDRTGKAVPWFRVVNETLDKAFLPGLTWGGYQKYLEVQKEKKP
jgi:hypothetical protein